MVNSLVDGRLFLASRQFEYSWQLKARIISGTLMNCRTKEIHKSYQSVADTKSVIKVTGTSTLAGSSVAVILSVPGIGPDVTR